MWKPLPSALCPRLMFSFQMKQPRGLVLFLPQISLVFLLKQLFPPTRDFRLLLPLLQDFEEGVNEEHARAFKMLHKLGKYCQQESHGLPQSVCPPNMQHGQEPVLVLTCPNCYCCQYLSNTCQIKTQPGTRAIEG